MSWLKENTDTNTETNTQAMQDELAKAKFVEFDIIDEDLEEVVISTPTSEAEELNEQSNSTTDVSSR